MKRATDADDAGAYHGDGLGHQFGENDTVALYTTVDGALRYAIRNNGEWSETRTIVLDDRVSNDLAVSALRKMVAEQ